MMLKAFLQTKKITKIHNVANSKREICKEQPTPKHESDMPELKSICNQQAIVNKKLQQQR
jgi:hypothetical protein